MSAIVWVTCPECGYRFYLVEGDVGKNNIWFCPQCGTEFPENVGLAAEADHPGKPAEGWSKD